LLIGGVLPGILLSISFVAWIIIRVKISPHLAPQETNLVHHKGWARWQPFFAYVLPTLSIFGVVVIHHLAIRLKKWKAVANWLLTQKKANGLSLFILNILSEPLCEK
jgi:hypothetical protein